MEKDLEGSGVAQPRHFPNYLHRGIEKNLRKMSVMIFGILVTIRTLHLSNTSQEPEPQ
jgi:NADH:ubiquinone oxidoreductase subunit D